MKKKIILLGTLIISGVAFSQVGIDTDTPKATLDIKASPTSTTKIDGLIAPRLKGSELKTNDTKYASDQDGAIVYVTEALASANTSTKTANVTSIGYYYFDKTQGTEGRWMKIANPTTIPITTIPIVIGVFSNTAPSNDVNSADYNTGTYIELPAGKWVVNATMLLRNRDRLLPGDVAFWIRAAFSTSPSSFIQAGNTLSGSLVGPSQYGLMNGIVVINNTSGIPQKYYLWRTKSDYYGPSYSGVGVLDNFAGAWTENQIVAMPVN